VDPEVTVHVEALADRAHLYARRIPGPGGLPAGVQGRALVLLSGGFDSSVAAWRVMRRGAAVDFVLCNLGGRAYERMVLRVARVLCHGWGFGVRSRLFVIDFAAVVDALRAAVKAQYWQVVLKRLMYRAAERIALEIGAQALVTGEALGQVSSQTLANLSAIDAAVQISVLRPLIGCDKTEIMAEARRIGTAPLSQRVKEYCALVPGHTVTATTPSRVVHAERYLAIDALWAATAARREIDLRAHADETRSAYLFTHDIPRNAVVIDCQPEHLYSAWHMPGAERHDPSELVVNPRRLDRDRTYVLYCSEGTQAAYLAELLQRAGYDAYAFDGGATALRRHVEAICNSSAARDLHS
jgi:thiamine biosynthesis protein ThiI